MNPVKMFALMALTALMAIALAGTSSAVAESTALCTEDGCAESSPVGHIHLTGRAKVKMFGQWYVCDVLFLGTIHGSRLGSPLTKLGLFIYTNCNPECTVEEENGSSEIKLLKEGHETASAVEEFLIHVVCSLVNCSYTGVGLKATVKGPLLSVEENGELAIPEQTLTKEAGGFFCPKTTSLEVLTTPLSPMYISS